MLRKHPGQYSIKEAFDNLPDGFCYFNDQGLLILCNKTMHRLAFGLLGTDLQTQAELADAIYKLPNLRYTDEYEHTWQFQIRMPDPHGRRYCEFLALDVTDLIHETLLLQSKNAELQELSERMEHIQKNIIAIGREEEILSLKMQIHDQMGKGILNLHHYYQNGCHTADRPALKKELTEMLSVLQGNAAESENTGMLEELQKTAKSIGSDIQIEGDFPNHPDTAKLIILAIRESLVNAIRHGNSHTLYVKLCSESHVLTMQITNDGLPPSAPVVEGGGLRSLRKKIELNGGSMQITSLPEFILQIKLPLLKETSEGAKR